MTNAIRTASQRVGLIRQVITTSKEDAVIALTLANLRFMAELVFCFGAGKYNDVEMVLVIIGDTNKDKVYKQEELVTA